MASFPKPKVLGDVNFSSRTAGRRGHKTRGSVAPWSSFSRLPERINLSYRQILRIPLFNGLKSLILVVAALLLVFGSVTAPTMLIRASSSPVDDAERATLEAQLTQLEDQINQYENQIVGYQKQGKNLKGEIQILNNKISKLNLQIQAINLTLKELGKNISETRLQITATEQNISAKKSVLGQLLQNLYSSERASPVEIFLRSRRLSDFFSDLNNVTLVQSNLRVAVEQVIDLQSELKDKQGQFLLARADAESVQAYQDAQKTEIDSVKAEKNKLLEVTKGQESKYQTLLKQTKETATQIRSRIFQLLGGGELSFEDAYQYAKLAGGATGVRPALILAVLDRESALGQNVGKCSYRSAMSPSNQTIFLEITRELNINPDVVTVSCPNRDGVYGGAMGPAQFVPATWKLYKDAVSKITSHYPASPWNNADAFAATALYLQNSMDGCNSVYSSSESRERCVAAKYYAGSRWRSYLWTYGEAVVNRANSFQGDIDAITS